MVDRKVQHIGCDMLPAGHHQPQPSEGHQPPGKKIPSAASPHHFSLILPELDRKYVFDYFHFTFFIHILQKIC
jgi:hypothetical protein